MVLGPKWKSKKETIIADDQTFQCLSSNGKKNIMQCRYSILAGGEQTVFEYHCLLTAQALLLI